MVIPDSKQVDHKNLDKLDCTRENLRQATPQGNAANCPVSKNNFLGVKGVSISRNKFRADIMVDGKRLFLGRFDTIEEAHDLAAIRSFGEFART